jgi:mono/diheme cytochrome c family protein
MGIALLITRPACAQDRSAEANTFVVNDSLARAGETVWSAKGCLSCHTIGKENIIAPDLAGVFTRRTPAWIKSLIQNPEGLLEKDDTAKALLERYNFLRMPNFSLTDAEIEAVMHYIAAQSRPDKK